MKKVSFLTGLLCLTFWHAKAQITIDQTDLAGPGDKVVRANATAGATDYTLTGANFNWDFSTLAATSQDTLDYFNITSAPLFTQFIFNGFNPITKSQMFNNSKNPLNFPQALSSFFSVDSSYSFIKKSASRFAKTGFSLRLNGIDLPLPYDSNDVVYKLPMNFNSTDSSNSMFEINIPTLDFFYYQQTQKRVNKVDGYGTLLLPGASAPMDVLRVKSELYIVDTIHIDTLIINQGFKITRPKEVQYKWLAKAKDAPVLEVVGTEVAGVFTPTVVKFLPPVIPNAIENAPSLNSIKMYPNPANDVVTITGVKNCTIEICNAFGQAMHSIKNASYMHKIASNAWPAGIYIVHFTDSSNKKRLEKLVITK
jgi:hypothetical protein